MSTCQLSTIILFVPPPHTCWAVKVCHQGKGKRCVCAWLVWGCLFSYGSSDGVTNSLSLQVAAGLGVNFCSTCGPTVYPLTRPPLMKRCDINDLLNKWCLTLSPFFSAFHPSRPLFPPSFLTFSLALCVKGKLLFFFTTSGSFSFNENGFSYYFQSLLWHLTYGS